MKTKNKILGDAGERIAEKYLKKCGYKCVKRNYVTNFGEVDLICVKEDVLAFVEVKTRSKQGLFQACDAVTKEKQKKYIKCAKVFIMDSIYKKYRVCFDVIEIVDGKINHIINAFYGDRF